jgi:hypothetical protein
MVDWVVEEVHQYDKPGRQVSRLTRRVPGPGLGAEPTPLGTAEGQRRGEDCVGADPAEARRKALDSRGPFSVGAPDWATEPEHAGVGAPHGVVDVRVLHDRQGGAELFLGDNASRAETPVAIVGS